MRGPEEAMNAKAQSSSSREGSLCFGFFKHAMIFPLSPFQPTLFIFLFNQGESGLKEGRDPCSSPPSKRLKQGNIFTL